MYSNPQVLVDLDNYQLRHRGSHITMITAEAKLAIAVHGHVEDAEEIDWLMRERPHSPKRLM